MAIHFEEFKAQYERPYWSPVHPSRYTKRTHYGRTGWGILYPEDIGGFNLMWLLSGVGLPPDDYDRYTTIVAWVIEAGLNRYTLGRLTLKEAAAVLPINRFAEEVFVRIHPNRYGYGKLADALRLRV